jgi:hypothetical protein
VFSGIYGGKWLWMLDAVKKSGFVPCHSFSDSVAPTPVTVAGAFEV